MKFSRIPVLIAVGTLALSACNREEAETAQAVSNPLLFHVPADTPYLFANIEPTPPEVIDAFMARFGPALGTAQALLDDFSIEINDGASDKYSEARLLTALLTEFDGKLNRAGLESMGLSLESHKVIYGMGIFPVVRVALKDADALRAMIGRVEASSGMTFTSLNSAGQDYWRVSDAKQQAGVYIAILSDHVAFSMFPTSAEAEWLPAFLGQSLPAASIGASKVLETLNKDKGYTNYGSGFLDIQRIAGQFLDESSRTATVLEATGHFNLPRLDEQCMNEVRGLIAKAPRLVLGTTELTANKAGISYQLEMDAGLAGQLMELVADVPLADKSPNKVVTASLGLRFGALRDFAKEKASAVIASPFQCRKLQELNMQAQTLLDQLNQPMPPFLNNLKGFRLSLDEIDFEHMNLAAARGMFSLEVEKPQMLVGMAQMFLPGMEELALEPGGDPVELPQDLMAAAPGVRVFAAMGDDSIGFAMGDGSQLNLGPFMQEDADNGNTFFSLEYDMTAPMAWQRKMQRQYPDADYGDQDQVDEFRDMIQSLQDSYMAWLGRSRLEVSFNEDGLQMDTSVTFK